MLPQLFAFAILLTVPADDSVSLTRSPKVGDIARYKQVRTVHINDTDVISQETFKETIKEIKKDGSIVIERLSEGGVRKLGDREDDIPGGAIMLRTHDKFGKLTAYKDEVVSPQGPELTQLTNALIYPMVSDKPGKAGNKWTTTFDNLLVKGKTFEVNSTLVGREKVDGVDLSKVSQKAAFPVDNSEGVMVVDVTFLLDKDGQRVKMEGTLKDVPSNYGPITVKITQERIKDKK